MSENTYASQATPKGESLLRLEDIRKVFYTDEVETHALSGIHMDIRRGEYVSIARPSGCGKSTLLSIIGLLDSPSEGEYILNNKPVAKLSFSDRAHIRNQEIGFIFQAFNLIGDLSVYENVELPLTYRDMPAAERRKRVEEALLKVGMPRRMKHYPSQLSGGQQQLVAVARACIAKPRLILADEPRGNLHSSQGKQIMELFWRLNSEGTTIVQVTHSEENAAYGNRIVTLADGWMVNE
jgi:putative ABC transport system ATP-binding protein